MPTILCVDDDPLVTRLVERVMVEAGHQAVLVEHAGAALQAVLRGGIDLVICDQQMPAITGLELLQMIRDEGVDVPIVMLTGHGSIGHAVEAMRAGAVDYVTKPFERAQLLLAVERALGVHALRRENHSLKRELHEIRGERAVLGRSEAMQRVLQSIAMAAPSRATVLLQGESGTGKELLARAIHDRSDRRERPFVRLNCAALPEGLIESALFGHERGAFTGAVRRAEGAFERADGGTLLLDEISEMRLDLQAKLLRVIQEQEFERVGGSATMRVDVRLVATTNRDLLDEVAAGRFREDLYFRLSVFPVYVPPLRERAEDIALLAHRFALRAGAELGKPVSALSPEAVALLQAYPWPGNVRELQHAIERAAILATGPVMGPELFAGLLERRRALARDLAREDATPSIGGTVPAGSAAGGGAAAAGGDDAPLDLATVERLTIERALRRTNQNRTQAARLLGISVRTLRTKVNVPALRDEA